MNSHPLEAVFNAQCQSADRRCHSIIEASIPAGKTYDEALLRATKMALNIWEIDRRHEDCRIEALDAFCTQLCQGNEVAGRMLASEALWNAGGAA